MTFAWHPLNWLLRSSWRNTRRSWLILKSVKVVLLERRGMEGRMEGREEGRGMGGGMEGKEDVSMRRLVLHW